MQAYLIWYLKQINYWKSFLQMVQFFCETISE